MEEQEVQTKCPETFTSILKFAENELNWAEIHQDLEDLNWLQKDSNKEDDIINGAWKVCDRWAVSVLEGEPVFKITKVNRVKMFVNEVVYNLVNNKDKLRQICLACKKQGSELGFFKKAKTMLSAEDEEDKLKALTLTINNIYKDLKQTFSALFMHLDKYLSIEINKNLVTFLDEQFFNQVINPLKFQLEDIPETKAIVDEYDRNYFSSSSYGGYSSIGYSSYSTYSSYPRENVYLGELDSEGKRSGYGKITHFNGDTYEGYWEDDKPHGKGVYNWKDWGRYEGDFNKGAISGNGKRIYSSGNIYVGEFSNGKKQGVGELRFKNGDIYEGEFDDEDFHGKGRYTWKSGDIFEGTFKRDKREGRGTLTLSTGEVIEGEWKDGVMSQQENTQS